jgi:hypothetical protein
MPRSPRTTQWSPVTSRAGRPLIMGHHTAQHRVRFRRRSRPGRSVTRFRKPSIWSGWISTKKKAGARVRQVGRSMACREGWQSIWPTAASTERPRPSDRINRLSHRTGWAPMASRAPARRADVGHRAKRVGKAAGGAAQTPSGERQDEERAKNAARCAQRQFGNARQRDSPADQQDSKANQRCDIDATRAAALTFAAPVKRGRAHFSVRASGHRVNSSAVVNP